MLSNYAISAIRTYTPLAVGALLTWLASSLRIVIDPSSQAGLVALCTAVLTALYWLLVRLLERVNPKFGVLLGVPAQPVYVDAASRDGAAAVAAPPHLAEHAPGDDLDRKMRDWQAEADRVNNGDV